MPPISLSNQLKKFVKHC